MAMDAISRSVLESAQKEADRMLEKARKAAEARVNSAREAAEQDGERRFQAAARALDEEGARRVIRAKGGHSKELLAARNARLAEVFAEAKKAVLGLPAAEYGKMMGGLLGAAAGGGAGTVRFHPEDGAVFTPLLVELNKGRATDAQLSGDASLKVRGGFIFQAGAYSVDQTLDTLLADVERELAPQIAASLFE